MPPHLRQALGGAIGSAAGGGDASAGTLLGLSLLPAMQQLRLCSWHAASVFGGAGKARRWRSTRFLVSPATPMDSDSSCRDGECGFRAWRTVPRASGGVTMLVSPRMHEVFDEFAFEEVVRMAEVLVDSNVHVVQTSAGSPVTQLHLLLARMPSGASAATSQPSMGVIAGDINSFEPYEGRLNARSDNLVYDACPFVAVVQLRSSGPQPKADTRGGDALMQGACELH